MNRQLAGVRRRHHSQRTNYQKLEVRNLLAHIYHNPDNGILYITGDSGDNVGSVTVSSADDVVAEIDGFAFSGASSTVSDIVFIGYGGDDTFSNFSSRSATMYGQLGNDTLVGGSGDDNLVGGSGNDTIRGNAGDDRIVGAFGDDNLEGGEGNDRMFGTGGFNTIFGGDGDDIIYGSELPDEIHGDAGADKIYGLGGDDMLYTGAGGIAGGTFDQGDLAMGHGGDDQFFGESGLDIFYGGDGDDVMEGGSGENRQHGQAGNDTLIGGPLADYMTGADGNDTFEARGGVDFYNVGNGFDTIVYFEDYNPSFVQVTDSSGTVETRVQGERVTGVSAIEFGDRTISGSQAAQTIQDSANYTRLNGYRSANSVGFLSKPSDLSGYALAWSQQMAENGRESQSSFSDQQGLLTGGRTVVGENVGSVEDTGQTAVEIANYFFEQWQADSRDNMFMLRADFTEVGVGILRSGGMWWATQIFTG